MNGDDDEAETFFGKVADPPADAGEPVTFDELKDHLMPPGANKEALWDALKAAQRSGGTLPGRTAPDISGPASAVLDVIKRAFPALSAAAPLPEPEDPFTPGDSATIAIADTYFGLIDRGVPVASVERIIGIWLGALPGSEPQQD